MKTSFCAFVCGLQPVKRRYVPADAFGHASGFVAPPCRHQPAAHPQGV